MAVHSETTPLLAGSQQPQPQPAEKQSKWVVARILMCGFIVSMSLSFTQVPMLYAFRLMTCDEYYKTHDHPPPGHDRCAVHAIEAETARQVTLVGTSTTIVGVLNLLLTGWVIKKFGPRFAMTQQTFWPCIRLCCQTIGVGGVTGDIIGITAPWEIAFCSMAFATLYALFVLPYVPPSKEIKDEQSEKKGLSRFLGPTKMLAPQKWRLPDGRVKRLFNVPLLFAGIFTGVLATGYIPTLIQMFSTIKFEFGTTENGILMSYYCVIRGVFLTIAFPHIIEHGRKWYNPTPPPALPPPGALSAARARRVSAAENVEAAVSLGLEDGEEPPVAALELAADDKSSAFDLFFLKWSLVVDGCLTGLATLCARSWHVFVVASLLPLASGSAAAAKSVMIEMCPAAQKADALMSLFGVVFSELAEVGRPDLVFVCNAAIAICAAVLLIGCRFPPEGSERVVGSNDGSEADDSEQFERVQERIPQNGK
ncbi:putative major facilitator superfamily transporter protein [Neofusicoccum parvum UCRNP2]|uniref:Putative major facilitator superfamily transporter protein n=1 Tax=Botryosphaeria parva (strain UCR-NP2) TaxID=1287680 RepID=R1EJG0_BOTPV|nr:putative major facilitator superfamily transporter protein [Neofusicoccum parvum UCRNP2]